MTPPPSPASSPRSLGGWVYWVVRPVVRPVGRWLRMFLVGRLEDEIAALRAEVRALREGIEREREVEKITAEERVREVMAQALATLAVDRER